MSNQKSTPASNRRKPFSVHRNAWLLILALFVVTAGCSTTDDKLPILGQREAVTKTVDGKDVVDSVYHSIPDFKFVSQYGDTVTAKALDNKIYVADFFFTTCPTICPKMKTQLKRVYDKYKGNPDVMLLSHTIDPEHDSVAVLKEFATGLGIADRQWLFVTGSRDDIYEIGQNSYMVTAQEDASAPGGVVHSGAFILVDKEKHIRGVYDGTTEEGVNKLMADMDKLLREYQS
ncbi:SCO family protein [Fibrisoma montanum]|uniref:SCO family protein n=1 Tax=Fibrisoma montanum TaxID=2305895 RepID=A0A418M6Z0_9BACT|nr:SCO family protein [Fibrisoma montanum]RIV21624.1 SCO family protein [Fibrisoma montanum]